jgi:hypothetical protein
MVSPARFLAPLVLVISAISAAWPFAQQAPPVSTGLIVGRVVDAKDGTSIAGAVVTLGGPASRKVLVDGQGRFYFNELPAGAFTLTATKAHYLQGAFGKQRADVGGRPLELTTGEHVTDVVLRMWRVAAISGTVTDDVGEPVSGARVQALRRTIVAGRSRLVRAGLFDEISDDLGGYRFGALVPGDYLIVTATYTISAPATAVGLVDAVRRTGGSTSSDFQREAQVKGAGAPLLDLYFGTGMQRLGDVLVTFGAASAPTPADPAAIAHYPTVWHPAAGGPAQATAVTVASGDERGGIDLHLRLTTSVRVSGVVAGPDGPVANLGLRLVPAGLDEVADETAFTPGITASAVDGSFTFIGVDPGQYTIRAATMPRLGVSSGRLGAAASAPLSAAVLWVATPITVGDSGLTGVRALVRTGARLAGRIAFDGTAAPLSATELTALKVAIEPADGRLVAPALVYAIQVDASGAFSNAGLVAGRYFIRVPGAVREWTLKSAVAGGRDVSDVPLEVGSNDIDSLVLTLTDHPPVLAGTVRTAQGNPDADATVFVFPADPSAWIDTGSNPRRLRTARPSRSGAFTLTGLPPGDYNAVAVDGTTIASWQDPAVLQALARVASRVHVDDGQRASAALVTTVVR